MSVLTEVSVVIPCHSERGWADLVKSVASAQAQQPRPAEIVVVVDHNPALYARARATFAGVSVLQNQFRRGASGTRNTGAQHTCTPLIAFLDGDATARPQWLVRLVAPFSRPHVVGTGGSIAPAWARPRPGWLPDEFLWTVGASYTGMPDTTAPIRNVWSASMVVRRDVFTAVGGFRDGFGKVGDRARPEDTDLCLRMSQAGGRWMYVPDAVVEHPVTADRTTFRFFLRRCYAEGRGKVQMARLLRGTRSLGAERDYLRRTLPRAVVRALSAAVRRGSAPDAARAGTLVAGVAAAAAGGAVESLAARLPARRPERRRQPVGANR